MAMNMNPAWFRQRSLRRDREDAEGFVLLEQRPRFSAGDQVRVSYEGISGHHRSAILLDLLGRKVRVVLDSQWSRRHDRHSLPATPHIGSGPLDSEKGSSWLRQLGSFWFLSLHRVWPLLPYNRCISSIRHVYCLVIVDLSVALRGGRRTGDRSLLASSCWRAKTIDWHNKTRSCRGFRSSSY